MTPKQEKFAQCVADGMSQADAYRTAFDVKPTTKPETIQDSASKLMTHPEVSHRVRELKEQLSSKALWTRADSVRALQNAISIAENKDNAAGLVAAIKELNAMHGFNEPSKLELTGGMQNVNKVVFEVVNP
jgi:hypothetical protein